MNVYNFLYVPILLILLALPLLLGGRSPLGLEVVVVVVGGLNILFFSSVFWNNLGVGLLMLTREAVCGEAGLPIVGMWLALWFGILLFRVVVGADGEDEEDNVFWGTGGEWWWEVGAGIWDARFASCVRAVLLLVVGTLVSFFDVYDRLGVGIPVPLGRGWWGIPEDEARLLAE